MSNPKRFHTKITQMLGIEHPVLCGGMQWITNAEFVASVCNAGGTGFISAESCKDHEALREEIRKMPQLTDKPFGVNISMLPEFNVAERTLKFCDVVCEEGVAFVETAGRSPEPIMDRLKSAGVKVIHKVTSVRHAEKAEKLGADAITMIGFGSGGHVGNTDVANFILVPLAVSRLTVPVICGGGVTNGKGLLGALAMGAQGVLMGTGFLATKESPIHDGIKQKLVATPETGTALVMRSILNPLRCVRNELADKVLDMEAKGCTLEEILTVVAGGIGKQAYECGDPEISPISCGQVVGMIDQVKSVKEVMDKMITEALDLLARLNRMTG